MIPLGLIKQRKFPKIEFSEGTACIYTVCPLPLPALQHLLQGLI